MHWLPALPSMLMPHLMSILCGVCREREGAEKNRESLLLAAREVEEARTGAASELERLGAELEAAERLAAAKQQEYIDARNRAQGLGQDVDGLRSGLSYRLTGKIMSPVNWQHCCATLPSCHHAFKVVSRLETNILLRCRFGYLAAVVWAAPVLIKQAGCAHLVQPLYATVHTEIKLHQMLNVYLIQSGLAILLFLFSHAGTSCVQSTMSCSAARAVQRRLRRTSLPTGILADPGIACPY